MKKNLLLFLFILCVNQIVSAQTWRLTVYASVGEVGWPGGCPDLWLPHGNATFSAPGTSGGGIFSNSDRSVSTAQFIFTGTGTSASGRLNIFVNGACGDNYDGPPAWYQGDFNFSQCTSTSYSTYDPSITGTQVYVLGNIYFEIITSPPAGSENGNYCGNADISFSATNVGTTSYAWQYSTNTSDVNSWQTFKTETQNSVSFKMKDIPGISYGTQTFFRYQVFGCNPDFYFRPGAFPPTVDHYGPFIAYPPAPIIDEGASVAGSPSCPTGDNSTNGTLTIAHTSISDGEEFIYSVTQYVPKIYGQACPNFGYGSNQRIFAGDTLCQGYKANFKNAEGATNFPLTNANKIDGDALFAFRPGWYTVTIESKLDKDDNSLSCPSDEFELRIAPPNPLTPSLSSRTPPSCVGGKNGSAEFTITNGQGPFTWRVYKTGASTQNIKTSSSSTTSRTIPVTGLPAHNNYTFEVTDTYCSVATTTTFAIAESATTLAIASTDISGDPPSCLRDFDNNGVVESITGSSVTATATPISGVKYSFYLYSGSTLIDQAIDLTTNSHSFTNMPAGAYYDSVRTDNGCKAKSTTVTLLDPTPLISTPVPANTTCSNTTDGRITLTDISKTRGSINYTYIITKDGDAGFLVTGPDVDTGLNRILTNTLDAGTYDVTIIDNCLPGPDNVFNNIPVIRRTPITIDQQEPILLACYNDRVSPTIVFRDGTPNYTVDVKKGATSLPGYPRSGQTATTFQLTSIDRGNYSVIVTDACGVSDNMDFVVTSNATSQVNAVITKLPYDNNHHLTCYESEDGRIKINVDGGIPGSGTYKYMIELLNAAGTVSLINNVTDNNNDSGSISAYKLVNGKYQYLISGLDADIAYRVRVTDYNNNPGACSQPFNRDSLNATLALSDPDLLQIAPININSADFTGLALFENELYAICKGDQNGVYTATISGGNAPYTVNLFKKALDADPWPASPYAYENNVADNTAEFSGLGAGFYKVEVIDQQSCQYDSRFFEIKEATASVQAESITAAVFAHGANTKCHDTSDGSITIEASGGVGNYTYFITGDTYIKPVNRPEAFHTFTDLAAKKANGDIINYTIALRDTLGCPWSMTNGVNHELQLTSPDTVKFSWAVISDITPGYEIPCRDDEAVVRITSEGGHFPHEISVSGQIPQSLTSNADSADFSLLANTYTASFTDALGCPAPDQTIELKEPDTHVAATAGTISFPACVGNNDGQIEVSAAGGIQFPNPNEFMFLIREANAAEFDTDTLRGTNVTFFRPANYFTSQDYEIMSIDAHGCSDTIPVTMPVNPDPLMLTSIEQVSPSCYGGTDGYITVSASNYDLIGGTSLRFKLSGGHLGNTILETVVDGTTVTFNDLQGTDLNGYTAYRAWVEDANNCQDTAYQYIDDLFLPSFEPITASLMESIRPSCFNGTDGSLLVKITGGVPPYQYSRDNVTFLNVNPADNIVFIDNLAEGTYTFYVIDSNYQPTQPTCLSVTSFDVAPGRFIKLTTAATPVSCVGGNDGAINLTVDLENLNEPFQPNRLSLFWTYDNVSPTDPVSAQEDINGLRAGRYTVHAAYDVDSLTCVNQAGTTIQQPSNGAFRISDVIIYDASCGGTSADGIATVSITGGWPNVPSYYRLDTTTWIPFSNATFMLSGLSPGQHSIEISQSSFECNDSQLFTVGSASMLLTLQQVIKPSCPLNEDGMVIVTSPSANAEFALEGGTFQPLGVFTGLAKGTHRFVARHNTQNTCQSEVLEVDVEDPVDCGEGPLSLILGDTAPATCATVQDGQAEVIARGGVPSYQFFWDGSNIPGPADPDNLSPGNHTVKVIDAIGSSVTIPVIIDTLDLITFQTFTTLSSCVTSRDGTATLLIGGGSGNPTVSWEGFTGSSRPDLYPGQYDFTISDNRNPDCAVTGSVLIEHYPDLQIDLLTARPPVCPGGTDGYLDTDVNGGSGDYTILWNNTTPGERLNGHVPGDYTISVIDNELGCTKEITFTLPDATPITVLSATITSPRCFGGSDGKIVLDAGNVSAPLVEWDNGQIGLTASGLKAGTYGYTITGASGCSITGSEEVTERPALTVTHASAMPSCFGVCNGSASLTISGGVAPYAIRWSHGPRTSSIVNLCPGTYSYTVTDNLNCQISGTVVITAPAEVTIAKTSDIKPACFGDSNGSITIEASGGTGNFTYSWASGQTSPSITGVTAGDYVVTVTDENQCSRSKTFSLTGPSALFFLQDKVTEPSCLQSTDGKIIPNPTGGTSPYEFLWNDQSTASIKENLPAGQYILRVTDAKGCTAQKTYGLQAPSSLAIVNVVPREPLCFNDENGSISTEAIGGTSPYTFSWNNSATTAKITDLSAGQYTLTVTDKKGCTSVTSYTLNNPAQPSIAGIPEIITICIGSPTTIEPEGEWSKYQWTGPQNFKASTRRIETSLNGAYTLNTLNLNGCPAQTNFTIEASEDALIADFLRLTEAIVYEPVVFVDISTPQPTALQWVTPDNNDVVVNKQSKENIEIVFTRPGTFEIGMIASMGTCQSEIYKTVVVAEPVENPDNSGGRIAVEDRPMSAVVYPNPATAEITIKVAVPSRDPIDLWLISPVENRAFFHETLEGQFDYLIEWNITKLTTGVYHLIYKQNNTTRSERIAVIR